MINNFEIQSMAILNGKKDYSEEILEEIKLKADKITIDTASKIKKLDI